MREWLAATAGGYVYDPATETYRLPAEHIAVHRRREQPLYMGGMFQSASAIVSAQDHMEDRFA